MFAHKLFGQGAGSLEEATVEDLDQATGVVGEALLDPEFHRIVEEQFRLRQKFEDKVMQVLASEQLYRAFLASESSLLTRAGISQNVATDFLEFRADVSSSVENSAMACCHPSVPLALTVNRPPTEIYQIVDKLRGGYRHAAGQLKVGQARTSKAPVEKAKPVWRGKVLTGALHGTLGLGLFGLNATAWAATLGIAGPMCAISGGLGAIACERAYNRISDALEET
jgi:hypothetical protein